MTHTPPRHLLALVAALVLPGTARADDFFEKSVRPILTEHCYRCHGPDKQKGGLRVDSREALLTGGDNGAALVPGKPNESTLVKAVQYKDGLEMPPNKRLSDDQIAVLAKWVKDGAAWAGKSAPTAQTGHAARKPGSITDEDRKWWAFQPPTRPTPPTAGGDWAKTHIDRFVIARLEKEGLKPAPEASRRALIRRVTFDLTGLPPTPEEVEAFVSDTAPDAYEKVVDRLLASPRYGERQARAWLDLVRYAESDGYRLDSYRPNAWRYRDYVIKSFNADKPYDRFVKEQLAGDELYPNDPDARVATGFLRLWPYEYNQKDARTQLTAVHTDITDVTADALLGLGFQCARCHDHKFDPILQKDYYSLRAFFAGLSFADEPVFASTAAKTEYEQKLAAWETKTAELRTKLEALLAPARVKAAADVTSRFPPDVQDIVRKPVAERTPGEQQLAELAGVQIEYFAERDAEKKVPKDKKATFDQLKKDLVALAGEKPAPPIALVARDIGPKAADVVIPGGRKGALAVDPALPTVLGGAVPPIKPSETSTGRRSALAAWLTRPDHPLTARVIVNRVWQGHFGAGLVSTPSDFGTLGERPSHPELLDWLAVEFVEGGKGASTSGSSQQAGWSFKRLHRLIVTSAVYRQSATGSAPTEARTKDPENRLLWRMPVRRLDAEQVRDAMLAVSGELKPDADGPSIPASQPRRSVYTRATRNTPDPLLASFDAADGVGSCARRNVTVTPTQSLLLLNGPSTLARASALAARVMPADGKDVLKGVEAAYRLAFGRPPTTEEAAEARDFLRQQVGATSGKAVTQEGRKKAWTDFCHALLNANEFLFLD